MAHNPFITPRKPPKPRKDREYKDGRKYLADKTELRRLVFERSGGKCEDFIEDEPGQFVRCNVRITLDSMDLSHKKHGYGFRDDSSDGCIASCCDCHQNGRHGSKCNYPRRAGKVMTTKKAQEYWRGVICFCNAVKPSQWSFCVSCLEKLPNALRHDLEHTQGKDYLRVLAECETAILKHDINKGA